MIQQKEEILVATKKMLKKYDVHRVSYTESTPHFSCAQEIQMYLHVQTQFKKTDF